TVQIRRKILIVRRAPIDGGIAAYPEALQNEDLFEIEAHGNVFPHRSDTQEFRDVRDSLAQALRVAIEETRKPLNRVLLLASTDEDTEREHTKLRQDLIDTGEIEVLEPTEPGGDARREQLEALARQATLSVFLLGRSYNPDSTTAFKALSELLERAPRRPKRCIASVPSFIEDNS